MSKNDDWFGFIAVGFIIGFAIAVIFAAWIPYNETLSQETLDEVCVHITNNSVSEAEVVNWDWRKRGDLKCTTPSYDHTQRIIVEKNNE